MFHILAFLCYLPAIFFTLFYKEAMSFWFYYAGLAAICSLILLFKPVYKKKLNQPDIILIFFILCIYLGLLSFIWSYHRFETIRYCALIFTNILLYFCLRERARSSFTLCMLAIAICMLYPFRWFSPEYFSALITESQNGVFYILTSSLLIAFFVGSSKKSAFSLLSSILLILYFILISYYGNKELLLIILFQFAFTIFSRDGRRISSWAIIITMSGIGALQSVRWHLLWSDQIIRIASYLPIINYEQVFSFNDYIGVYGWFGSGLGSSNYFSRYFDSVVKQMDIQSGLYGNLVAELGILSVLILPFLFYCAQNLLKKCVWQRDYETLSAKSFINIFGSIAFFGVVLSGLFYRDWSPLSSPIWALTAACAYKNQYKEEKEYSFFTLYQKIGVILGVIFCIFCLFVSLIISYLQEDRYSLYGKCANILLELNSGEIKTDYKNRSDFTKFMINDEQANFLSKADEFMLLGDQQAVSDYLQKAIKKSPNSIDVLFKIARFEEMLGNVNVAVQIIEKCVSLKPHNSELRLELARLMERLSKFQSAADRYFETLKIDRSNNLAKEKINYIFRSYNILPRSLRGGKTHLKDIKPIPGLGDISA